MSKSKEFLSVLNEYADFLSASSAPGASHWAQLLREASSWSDIGTIAKKVRSFYGGMGSINDIVFPFKSAAEERNESFGERLFELAEAVIRENEA